MVPAAGAQGRGRAGQRHQEHRPAAARHPADHRRDGQREGRSERNDELGAAALLEGHDRGPDRPGVAAGGDRGRESPREAPG